MPPSESQRERKCQLWAQQLSHWQITSDLHTCAMMKMAVHEQHESYPGEDGVCAEETCLPDGHVTQ